jgi:dihydrofolate reductase
VLTRGNHAPYSGQRVVHSLDDAIDHAGDAGELAVIGGGEVYALALPRATHLHLTWVDTEVADADAYFPPIEARDFVETAREVHAADARHAFAMTFIDYARR